MEECLFVDAHAFQLKIARLQQRNGHWHVTETHRYSEVTDEKQWTKTFEKSWGSIARHAPKEIVFILPDAFVGNLSVPINGDVNFSVEQRLQRALRHQAHQRGERGVRCGRVPRAGAYRDPLYRRGRPPACYPCGECRNQGGTHRQ